MCGFQEVLWDWGAQFRTYAERSVPVELHLEVTTGRDEKNDVDETVPDHSIAPVCADCFLDVLEHLNALFVRAHQPGSCDVVTQMFEQIDLQNADLIGREAAAMFVGQCRHKM